MAGACCADEALGRGPPVASARTRPAKAPTSAASHVDRMTFKEEETRMSGSPRNARTTLRSSRIHGAAAGTMRVVRTIRLVHGAGWVTTCLVLALGLACRSTVAPSSPPAATPGNSTAPAAIAGNVARDDYAGSRACAPCHADVVAAWERSPMHRMTRDLPGADVRAPFDGAQFHFKDATAVFERSGAERFMRIDSPGEPERT
jgi:hypothetical protein